MYLQCIRSTCRCERTFKLLSVLLYKCFTAVFRSHYRATGAAQQVKTGCRLSLNTVVITNMNRIITIIKHTFWRNVNT